MKGGIIAKLDEVSRVAMRGRRPLCKSTVKTYTTWLRLFYRWAGGRPAGAWEPRDIEAFCLHLQRERYAPKSRRQALCALVYVFKHVIKKEIGELNLPMMPKEKKGIKIIPTREELGRIFSGLKGQHRVMAGIMYGAGLRVNECCQLRLKDVDFETLTLRVHEGKGGKDRLCLLPVNLVGALQRQMAWRAALHERDLVDGAGLVELPGRLAIKYKNAARDLGWQYLFPSAVIRGQCRWYATPEGIQQAIAKAVRAAGIIKRITPHTLRHAYCTHSLRAGNDIATVRERMGHETLETTLTYAHGDVALGVSPLDAGDVRPLRMVLEF